MKSPFALGFAFLSMSVSPHPAFAEGGAQVKLSTGVDYSRGDYGDVDDTEIWYFPATAKASMGDWSAKVTVPYLRIKGPGVVVGGGGGGVQQSARTHVKTETGLGDVVGSLTYTYDFESFETYVDFTGKVKFPTADEDKGLGTGETDYTASVDVTRMIGEGYLFGGVGRKFVGESERFELDDIWLANIGGGYQMTSKAGVGVSYDFREAAGSGEDPSEASAFLTYKLTDTINIQAYGVVGFSEGSPDGGAGLQIGYAFNPAANLPE